MSFIAGYPLPPTSGHDEHGHHIPPHIPEWRKAAQEGDTDRVVRGSEVARDQRNKALFDAHLAEHRRRGEPADIVQQGV